MSYPATFLILASVMNAALSAQRQNPHSVVAAPWLAEGGAVNQVSDLFVQQFVAHLVISSIQIYNLC